MFVYLDLLLLNYRLSFNFNAARQIVFIYYHEKDVVLCLLYDRKKWTQTFVREQDYC